MILLLLVVDAILLFIQYGTDKFLAAHIKNLYNRIEELEKKLNNE
jgi:hypothetical protein